VRTLNFRIPEDLSRVILRALEKNKEKRYQRAEDLRADLAAVEKDLPVTEATLPQRGPAEKTVVRRRPPWVVPGLILGALVLSAILFFVLRGSRRPSGPAPGSAPRLPGKIPSPFCPSGT
jgi:hypothetical protein